MNKLKEKICFLLIGILSFFTFLLFIIFNISIYNRELNRINDKISRINSNYEKINTFYTKHKTLFLFDEIYIVKSNDYGVVESIITTASKKLSFEEIELLISKNKESKVIDLYFDKYLIFQNINNNIIIINNMLTKTFLIKSFLISISILIILEFVIVYVSILISKWIIKPVQESFNKQKQFISDASHELKTPISIITASAETIKGSKNDKKLINNIKEEAERMNNLVTTLLNLSKSEIVNNETIYELNLTKIINKKALSFECIMFEHNQKLNLDLQKDIMFVCNPDRITELLSILLDNAMKHADNGSTIDVILKKVKNNIILMVRNEGEEIPENEREKIFERFYRVDSSRQRNQNRYGLGLAIAKNIIESHNGKIFVECSNHVTSFIVKFKQK